jgi:branched-chain amino acid transport system substrate-binding protein
MLRNTTIGAAGASLVGLSGCTSDSGNGGNGGNGGGNGNGVDGGTSLKIGLLAPLSGPYSAIGVEVEAGVEVAVQHAADDFEDLSVDLVVKDSQLDPEAGMRRARELVQQENVDAMVVGDGTPVLNPVAQYSIDNEIPHIATISALERTTHSDCYPYTFRASMHSYQNMKPTAEWATSNLGKKVATWGADYSWGRESVENFVEVAENNGAEIVEQVWPKLGANDVSSQIQKVSDSDADFVIIRAAGADIIKAFTQINSFGLDEEMDIVGAGTATAAKGAGESALGYYGNTPYYFGIDTELNNRFVADYREHTDGEDPGTYSNTSYSGAKALFKAALQGGTDGPTIRDTLEGLSVKTPIGEQTIRACDHQMQGPQWVSQFVEDDDTDSGVGLDQLEKYGADNNSRPCSEIECNF